MVLQHQGVYVCVCAGVPLCVGGVFVCMCVCVCEVQVSVCVLSVCVIYVGHYTGSRSVRSKNIQQY